MKWSLAFGLIAGLAACGADGEPVQPTRNATITLSDSGASVSGQVGMRQGPFAVTVGLGL